MRIVPIRVWDSPLSFGDENGSSVWPEKPAPIFKKKKNESLPTDNIQAFALDHILSSSRILILEGISGSGKDTLQKYVKSKLRGRDVYDYSEGELLLSWNQRPIKDIFKLQVRLMRNFINYAAETINRDDRAVFLLNRFHLSTYTMGVTEQPKLEREYNIVLKTLRTLPTHVFILQLMESEIESRSSHPERGAAWHRFQQHILEREGFQNFLKRNVLLQKAMVETAIRQQIPFSVLRLPSAPNASIAMRQSPGAKMTANLDGAVELNPRRHPSQEAI
jgi:thymidylate kinase